MKKMENLTKIEGLLYESTLEEKTSADGSWKYIAGKLSIEIAPDNIVSIDFFEREITSKGTVNKKYGTLKSLIDGNSVLKVGKDNAISLNITSALTVDTFTPKGATEPINVIKNFGGFVNYVNKCKPEATFQADMLITGTAPVMEKNVETGELEPTNKAYVNGYIFDFANRILPVKFRVESESGVKYFEGLEPNTFTRVWGKEETIINSTKKIIPSSFGEDKVVEYTDTKKAFIITGSLAEPYEFDTEGILTVEEVRKALADRELFLASKQQKATEANSAPSTIINKKEKTDYKF